MKSYHSETVLKVNICEFIFIHYSVVMNHYSLQLVGKYKYLHAISNISVQTFINVLKKKRWITTKRNNFPCAKYQYTVQCLPT